MKKKKVENGDSPATQDDLSNLAGEMTLRFKEVNGEMNRRFDEVNSEMNRRFDEAYEVMATKDDIKRLETRIEQGQERLMSVLESIEAHFEDHRNLPERVARLERSEFGRK